MKALIVSLIIIVVLGAAGAGYWFGHNAVSSPASTEPDSAATQSADAVEPTATVQTVPIQVGHLTREVTAYGSVIAEASEVTVLSVPFESRVTRVIVKPGQAVIAGSELIEISPSPDTQLQFSQAQAMLESAKKDLAQTQARFNDRLATNQELLQAEQALNQAQLKVDSFKKSGADGPQKLKVDISGVVSKVDVQLGQVVPTGGPLVEIAGQNHIQVRLGVESDDAAKLTIGEAVDLALVHSDTNNHVVGSVQLITERVNPDTRLVDVYISLPRNAPMLLEGFVRAKLTVASADGLILPRNAVLPDDNDLVLFTVKDDKAVKHKVAIVLESGDRVVVKSEDIKEGDSAVVVGNYTLEDGMAVVAQQAPAAATQQAPATQQASATEESK
jgi:membrane fusion protein (multidrug efflux system)